MLRHVVRNCLRVASTVLMVAAIPIGLHAQGGVLTGAITDAETSAGLQTVQVYLQGTSTGTLTGQNGTFTLTNVPAGTYTVIAQRIGYQETRQENVSVTAGGTTTVNIAMSPAVLALQGIVATGLIDPVEGVRAPISIARVDRALMPVVASGAAIQSLQGRIAGMAVARTSGQPGEGVTMMLRTPTSLTGGGSPLIVVDGIILGGTSTVDIEAMDIESIEVIRGAAASSLYGSRAASGVIAITTARGTGLPIGETRFTARTEIGMSQNMRGIALNNSHHYLMDPTNSFYVNAAGERVTRAGRVAPPLVTAFMDKPYPDPIYDNITAVTRAGGFMSNNFSVSGNTTSTNFAVSLNNLHESGSLRDNDGYTRNTFRVNLDHRFMDALSLSTTMYHTRDSRENISGNPFNDVLRGPRDVDFTRRDEEGNYLQQPDPAIAYQNPLWTQATREQDESSTRTLASLGLTWNPLAWLTTSGTVGYDRGDSESRVYVPKGTPLDVGQIGESLGSITFNNDDRDTWNAEAQVTGRTDIGALNVRTTVRGLIERSRSEGGQRSGERFILVDLPQLSNIAETDRRATSTESEIRATGYLWDTAFDYDGKYILTVLGRRDGSSLFGPDNRWHTYYRLAGAWRIGQESWFNIPNVNEFKLSYARGTAGGRPNATAQYETWTLTAGVPTKGALGNTRLAPEHTLEQEVSLNMVLMNRWGIVLTHAWQKTTDQLVEAPQPNFTGYSTQWVNAGTIGGHTTELEVEAQLINTRDFGWTSMVVADYSYAKILDWPIPCTTPAWRFNCTGEPVYGVYSFWLIKDREGLGRHRGGDATYAANQFEVNDEGFLVWVGEGNHYWEGIEKNLWGTFSAPIGNNQLLGARTYQWGHPIQEEDVNGNRLRQQLGNGNPANFGWTNNVRVGAIQLHAQLQASYGGDANNRNHQQMTNLNSATAPKMDQAGKPDGLKKPIAYFRSANDGDASYYIEDASYLKLRTLSATYTMGESGVQRFGLNNLGIQNMTLGLIARNIFTVTNYDGFDPEQALNLGTRSNSDGGGYPPTRNLTAEVTVTF
jgi:TonB-linked SusC/RagA family outer membrane protein